MSMTQQHRTGGGKNSAHGIFLFPPADPRGIKYGGLPGIPTQL